jgi:hypothetical protein
MQARFTRNFLVFCMSLAISHIAVAQNASRIYIEPNGWSIGTNAGLSDLFGDIGTQSAVEHYTNSNYIKRVAFMGGMFGRYTVHPCFAIRLGLNYGSLFATDKWNYDLALAATNQGDDGYQRYARGQTVRDFIFEGSFLMELTPMRFNPESRGAHRRGQPYLGAGLAVFHFTPYTTVATATQWVKSYGYSLEGQGWGVGFPPAYSLYQLAIPLAFGYRWDLGQHLNLGIEYMYRMTFTDYLDGVSGKYISYDDFKAHLSPHDAQIAYEMADKGYFKGFEQPNAKGNLRGNPGNNDSYSTLSITFYYKILTNAREWWH